MGIFFKVEDKGKYLHIQRRKFTLSLSISIPVFYFIIAPILSLVLGLSNILLLIIAPIFIAILIFGIWMGIEGIYYGSVFPKRYEKQGKRVERSAGSGIKIYK